jgi:hypothetical protein
VAHGYDVLQKGAPQEYGCSGEVAQDSGCLLGCEVSLSAPPQLLGPLLLPAHGLITVMVQCEYELSVDFFVSESSCASSWTCSMHVDKLWLKLACAAVRARRTSATC